MENQITVNEIEKGSDFGRCLFLVYVMPLVHPFGNQPKFFHFGKVFERMQKYLSSLIIALAFSTLQACAHMDSTGTVKFAADAETNYNLGLRSVEDRRYLDAMQFFEHIRYRHPYSSVAALADLAIADTYFVQDKFMEAVEGYRNFVKLRPNHPKVDYAEYRIALSHYKDIPMDFFLFPPSHEKDQSAVRGAAANFEAFLRKYPGSEYVPEAKEKLRETRERLADHEMSVAAFYLHHDRYKSAAARYERMASEFPDSKRIGEALLGLADVQLKQGEVQKARATLEKLIKDFPEDAHRAEAEERLHKLIGATEKNESANKGDDTEGAGDEGEGTDQKKPPSA